VHLLPRFLARTRSRVARRKRPPLTPRVSFARGDFYPKIPYFSYPQPLPTRY
jgi:hypothetical protein